MEQDHGGAEQIRDGHRLPASPSRDALFVETHQATDTFEVGPQLLIDLVAFRHQSAFLKARTSTRLSKNVAPPPMSVRAVEVVLLALPRPGTSLFQ